MTGFFTPEAFSTTRTEKLNYFGLFESFDQKWYQFGRVLIPDGGGVLKEEGGPVS